MKKYAKKEVKKKYEKKTVIPVCYVCGKRVDTKSDLYIGNNKYRHRDKKCKPGSKKYMRKFGDSMDEVLRNAFLKKNGTE